MHIEDYRMYCLSKKGVTESIPFPKLQNVLVFKVFDKMFTTTNIDSFNSFSIKCVPETIEEFRANYDCLIEPSYFSKKHWCSVQIDNSISDLLLKEWLDVSYNLVVKNFTRKKKEKLSSL